MDTVVPAAAATVDAAARTVGLTGTDTGSGVARLEYKVDGAADWAAVAGPSAVATVGPAAATVQYRAVDAAGNLGVTGTATVLAAGNVSKDRSTTASISADVATSLTAKPGKVKPGEYLTLQLAGFDRFDTVRITLGDTSLGTVFTGVKGAGKVTRAVPAGTPKGVVTVTAAGSDGEPTTTAQVTVQ